MPSVASIARCSRFLCSLPPTPIDGQFIVVSSFTLTKDLHRGASAASGASPGADLMNPGLGKSKVISACRNASRLVSRRLALPISFSERCRLWHTVLCALLLVPAQAVLKASSGVRSGYSIPLLAHSLKFVMRIRSRSLPSSQKLKMQVLGIAERRLQSKSAHTSPSRMAP